MEDGTYKNSLQSLDCELGLFYADLKPPRPDRSEIEHLVTRLEGTIFRITLALPIASSYRGHRTVRVDNVDRRIEFSGKNESMALELTIVTPLGV